MTSNKRSDKSSTSTSTRLPPKSQQRKQADKPAKVNIKKILMEEKDTAERLKENLESLTERLVQNLDIGGVPSELVGEIQRQVLLVHGIHNSNASLTEQLRSTIVILSEATKAVEKTWSYCHCYTSLDVPNLANILDELQSVICKSASLVNKPLQRKIANLQSDPKADADALKELEGVSVQVSGKRINASCFGIS